MLHADSGGDDMKRLMLLAVLAVAVLGAGGPVWAQGQNQGQDDRGAAALPPALRAAVLSGNAQAVSQAINTLSGGNPQQAAALAAQTIRAAEQMLATNPMAAMAAAAAAVQTASVVPVQSAAPTNVETIITTAARIFSSPTLQAIAPAATAALATATLAAATASNNPTLTGQVAIGAVALAEAILVKEPTLAVTLAGAAVNATASQQVSSFDAQAVVTTASRIAVSPAASQVPSSLQASLNNAIRHNNNGNRDANGEETQFRDGSAT